MTDAMHILAVAAAMAAGAMPVTSDDRNDVRDRCARQRAAEPDAVKAHARFKACVARIPNDGDLPPKSQPKPKPR